MKLVDIIRNKARRGLKSVLNEAEVGMSGKTIVNVDIQPEYQSYFTFKTGEWGRWIDKNAANNDMVFLYNGESMGMSSEGEYKDWLLNYVDYELLDTATFYDKGYAYFRYCMDEGIDEDAIVDLIKYMIKHDVNDSREIDQDMWDDFMKETNHTRDEIRDLLETADDMINIPDVMEELKRYNSIVLTGGGVEECLKEVEIALMALDKPYQVYKKFTY